jgi:hypothetical protein
MTFQLKASLTSSRPFPVFCDILSLQFRPFRNTSLTHSRGPPRHARSVSGLAGVRFLADRGRRWVAVIPSPSTCRLTLQLPSRGGDIVHPVNPRTLLILTLCRPHLVSTHRSPDARSAVNDQARALQRVLQPSSLVPVGTGPSPDSIRALASVFGGAKGFVSHDVIVQLVRVEASVLTRRLYRLFPRHTLEDFLSALANVKHLRRLRTPRSAFATAAVLTEKEARLEFAFELYDLDGDGFVTEAELLEVVDKTMLGNAAKIASTLRVAMKVVGDGSDASENAFSNPVGVGTSTVSDHPRLDFQLFKKLAGRIPSVLFPAQTLYELLFEFGGGAKFVLDALRALEADTRYSLSRDGSGWAGPDSNGTPSVSGNTSPRSGSPGKGNGNGNRFVKTARDATRAVRERCAMMRKPELVKFLETLGMDLGLELMTFDELVDLAAAGALSTGRLAELPRQANGETQNSPLSSPSRRAQVRKPPGRQPRPARAPLSSTGNLADDLKQRSDDIIQGKYCAFPKSRHTVEARLRVTVYLYTLRSTPTLADSRLTLFFSNRRRVPRGAHGSGGCFGGDDQGRRRRGGRG